MLVRLLLISLLALVLSVPPALADTKIEIDRSFGSRGTVRAHFGPTYTGPAFTALDPLPDGSLQKPQLPEDVDAEGRTVRLFPATPEGSIERLNRDGTPDQTFGVNPYGEQSLSEPAGFRIETIHVLPSGKILVAGVAEKQVALARFEHDGHLDRGFGNGGVVKLKTDAGIDGVRLAALEPRPEEGVAVALLDKEKVEYSEAAGHSGSTIAVLTADGRPDASYGPGGSIAVPDAAILSLHALPDGGLLAAGDRWGPAFVGDWLYESDVVLARYGPSGTLDPGFGGGDGSVVLDLAGLDFFGSVLWAEDGSIWLGGVATAVEKPICRRYEHFCTETPFVAHVASGGTLDLAVGEGGIVRLARFSYPYGEKAGGRGVLALGARPGGGVFAAGGSGTTAFIAALTAAGVPDPGFGEGGFLTERDPRPSEASVQSLALDSRGRILVSGETSAGIVESWGAPALVRYLPNGRLDRSFGGGLVRVPGRETGVVVGEDDASFVLSGRSAGAVTKVRSDGRIDRSFGDEGTADIRFGPKVAFRGKERRMPLLSGQMVALSGGRLLIAGQAGRSFGRAFAMRLRADGTPDPTFGKGGLTLFGLGGHPGAVNQLAVQRDGRVLVAGYTERPGSREWEGEALSVLRLRQDGSRDPSFGHRGLALLPIARHSFAYALAVEGDGRILVAGKSFDRASRARELLLRLDARGRLDRSFGRRGIVSVPVPFRRGGLWWAPRRLLLQRHRILVLRDSVERSLVVYSRDGRRRRAFPAGRGAEPHHHWVQPAPRGALQDGKLLLGWSISRQQRTNFKLERLELRGRP